LDLPATEILPLVARHVRKGQDPARTVTVAWPLHTLRVRSPGRALLHVDEEALTVIRPDHPQIRSRAVVPPQRLELEAHTLQLIGDDALQRRHVHAFHLFTVRERTSFVNSRLRQSANAVATAARWARRLDGGAVGTPARWRRGGHAGSMAARSAPNRLSPRAPRPRSRRARRGRWRRRACASRRAGTAIRRPAPSGRWAARSA